VLLVQLALAEEVVLRNDTADDTFDTSDYVAWLAYGECAVVVFDPAPEDYALAIHTVQVFLGSSQGNQDHDVTFPTWGSMSSTRASPSPSPGTASGRSPTPRSRSRSPHRRAHWSAS
jgi:hypothetical protein